MLGEVNSQQISTHLISSVPLSLNEQSLALEAYRDYSPICSGGDS
jgi:hypothetical protein